MSLSTIDLVVVIAYAIGIFSLAQYVSREKAGHEKDTSDYFLASKNLPWWAIGSSLIATDFASPFLWRAGTVTMCKGLMTERIVRDPAA